MSSVLGSPCGARLPAILVAFCLVSNGAEGETAIGWRSGSAAMDRLKQTQLATAITGLAARTDCRHAVVQFDRAVSPTERQQLEQAGLHLLRYLGSHAFFASFSEKGVNGTTLGATPFLRGAWGIERAWKLDPRILAGDVPGWATVAEDERGRATVGLYVLFHEDVPLATEAAATVQQHGAVIRDRVESLNVLVVEVPLANVSALADEDAVQWMEWPLPQFGEVNDGNRAITEADIVQVSPYDLDGSGVTVLVYDGGTARASHVDFEGRLIVHDATSVSNHATHVAGTIGGAGIANPTYRGMAPGVMLLSYGFQYDGTGVFLYGNPGDIEEDYDQAINVFGADLANNSIGSNVERNVFPCSLQGDYGVTAALIDAIVAGSLGGPFRVVWASGNERQGSRCNVEGYGDYYSIAPPAGAKNHITVGALNSNDDSMTTFSSWGPVDDGRLKPDLSAPGCQSNGDGGVTSCSWSNDTSYVAKCGTSMASPTVCGISALLLQDFHIQFPDEPDFRNSTLKALLAHNAEDLQNVGPDYQTGYGSVRIKRTIDFMRTGSFLESQVDQGENYSVLVQVIPSDEQLKITLAWDDVPGTPNVDSALVNDLDLRVVDASSERYYPWTLDPHDPGSPALRTRPDHVNNIEQVLVDNPPPGVWLVRVFGVNVPNGPQSFSLCASPQMIGCSSQGVIGLHALGPACTATVEIQVVDCDLNIEESALETVPVSVVSDSEPSGETVLLTETGADTADFRGTIQLNVLNSTGVLWVTDSDTVTATYIDADDGQGGYDVTVTANVVTDCRGPQISGIQVSHSDVTDATVTFDTDEWAHGTVRYGLSCGSLTESVTEPLFRQTHAVVLPGLTPNTRYFFAIDVLDEQGNSSTDDNAGGCHYLFTRSVVYDFPLEADPGWGTEGQWAYGQPTGNGTVPPGDPTSGYTGLNVYGYNLDGDYGDNLPATYLTITALDCSTHTGTELRFRRWLGVDAADFDHASVEVSNDGTNWTPVWSHSGTYLIDRFWSLQTYDISGVADGAPEVYIRWVMGPTDGGGIPYFGWNIDDIQIIADPVPPPPTCEDGVQNQGESRIDCGGPCPPCTCLSDSACDDQLFCTGVETCDALGHCIPGTPVNCHDGVDCTIDSCNDDIDSCDYIPDDTPCDNGLFCDGAEYCDTLLGCMDGDFPCPPDKLCRESDDRCVDCLVDVDCADDDPCTGVEVCDADGMCVHVLSTDCNGNEIEDSCDIVDGTSQDCNDNVIPDECDIVGGTSSDLNGNSVPDECEVSAPAEAGPPHNARKNRYVCFDPGNSGIEVAFQVQIGSCSYFPGAVGLPGWVGEPNEDGLARFVRDPFFSVAWPAVVQLADCEIVPAATYEIRASSNGNIFSEPLELSTIAKPGDKEWGDVVGVFVAGQWGPPNGVVNMDDVMSAVQRFQQLPGAPALNWVDVDPAVPNAVLNMTDIFQIIQGFRGRPYPFSNPVDCP